MKTWHHILFWIFVYTSLTLVFTRWTHVIVEAFFFVSLLMPVIIATSYFFNYFLVPRYLFKRRFFLFGLYTFYMLVVSLCLEMQASILTVLLVAYYNINENGMLITDVFIMAGTLYLVVLVMSFILLIKHYLMDQKAIAELEKKQKQLDQGYFTVRSNRQTAQVKYGDLLYLESLGDYIEFHLANGTSISSKEKISFMEKNLPEGFLRIHRSFIVNQSKISSFSREFVVVGDKELPISRSYKQKVLIRLNGN
ncbi:MAG: LytTR family DNA-binding domain-containing protein [Bacteroidales bacterium]|nr:LytTR family DNA-binding domain-containing protein [Bacteroidales bacterium]